MPAVSKAQQRFMGAELGRKRAGKKTKTGMNEMQLEEFAATEDEKVLPQTKGFFQKLKEYLGADE